MRLMREEILLDSGGFTSTRKFRATLEEVRIAIRSVVWPPGSDSFALYDERHGNGVKPIKKGFVSHLRSAGWTTEMRIALLAGKQPGPIDAVIRTSFGLIAAEWETGNISSSHRAINKLCVGLLNGSLVAGVLVLPTRTMYPYLTDRIGNYEELQPYFPLWRSIPIGQGFLMIIAIEHDYVGTDVPKIPKGTDGRALG